MNWVKSGYMVDGLEAQNKLHKISEILMIGYELGQKLRHDRWNQWNIVGVSKQSLEKFPSGSQNLFLCSIT